MRGRAGNGVTRLPSTLLVAVLLVCFPLRVQAGTARFISGVGWGVPPGFSVVWHTSSLAYFTDPGPLSATVAHAQADAMVAAAAAVWNVPTSSLSLGKGGELAEDVDATNTYFDGTSFVFPADVQPANEGNIPVAVVYDVDGSLVDLLLGAGASDPDACRQNAVVGDVDDVQQSDGGIHHATLILNGRCVGSAPEELNQMQYQLARAFGRVLGLSWSQTNDNVFTGQATVTANQVAYWPLMHPIDVICGNYTYQCMSNPFTLRVDDLETLAQLYPVYQASVPPGKQGTSNDALYLWGILYFPTGQGMDWVNVTARRQNNGITEDWQTTSALTGYMYSQAAGTPLNSTPAINAGSTTNGLDGYFTFRRVPLNGVSNIFFTTEGINPLYSGEFAVGPYVRPPVTPSGSSVTTVDWSAVSTGDRPVNTFLTANDAASTCNPGQDGTESAPAVLDASGWQKGQLCGWAHNSWFNVSVAAGHSWTLEVTATDETGASTVNKAQPVMGVWDASDPAGTSPTVASQPVPFNSLALGMTQIQIGAPSADQTVRFSVSDQFGAGRPDFTYTARLLYAATVSPATLGVGGGRIVVSGTGFRQGNQLFVNNTPAQVLSWTATQIVANAPALAVAGAPLGTPLTVTVVDAQTAGSASISNALTYEVLPNLMQQVSAPAALETGVPAPTPFAVRVLTSDGLSPVPGALVTFAVVTGSAQFGACGTATICTLASDAHGVVQTTVLGGAPGAVVLSATEVHGGAVVLLPLLDTDPLRVAAFQQPVHYVAAGQGGSWSLQLGASQDGLPAVGVPVTWSVSTGLVTQSANPVTASNGAAALLVSAPALAPGSVNTVTGCAWSTVCASATLYGVDASQWLLSAPLRATQGLSASGSFDALSLTVTDQAGHLLEGAPVQVHQRVLAWEGVCPTGNRCPAAPVLAATESALTSDATGTITFTPLQVPDVPQVIEVAVSTGAQGFLTLTLVKAP